MRTIQLLVEYEGTGYAGWQFQAPPARTIQGELERALAAMTGDDIRIRGASRTDAGVHARGQVAVFETERSIPLIGFQRGLTSNLPASISVRRATEVEAGFDPRRRARGKRYRYTFWNDPQPSAIDARYSWYVRRPFDVAAMQRAAGALVGTHDFGAFRAADCAALHAVRTLYRVEVFRGDYSRLHVEVVGNAFVKNMVRVIAGTLRDVGVGRFLAESIPDVLASRERTRAGMTAPAHGLCLEEVIYDERLPPRPGG